MSPTATQAARQRGAVLIVALIALVTIMIAAAALVRAVDTSTIIAGNLAYKQAASASADAGMERAIAWMRATSVAHAASDPFKDAAHPFNTDQAAQGYYTSIATDVAGDMAFLTDEDTWTDKRSRLVGTDSSGNTIRYVIQRMCRVPGQVLSRSNCQFSDRDSDKDSHNGDLRPAKGGLHALNRITVRVEGPRNTVTYAQAIVY